MQMAFGVMSGGLHSTTPAPAFSSSITPLAREGVMHADESLPKPVRYVQRTVEPRTRGATRSLHIHGLTNRVTHEERPYPEAGQPAFVA